MKIYTEDMVRALDIFDGGAAILNLDTTIRTANDASLKLWGFNETLDLGGMNYADIKCDAAEFYNDFKMQHDRVLTAGKSQDLLCHLCYKDTWMTTISRMKPLYTREGDLDAVIGIGVNLGMYDIVDLSRFLFSDHNKLGLSKRDNQFCYYLSEPNCKRKLTKRELECLFFILRGKSASDIGDLLYISKRTVEMHSDALKNKFNTDNKSQLIELAIFDGYMNFIPPSLLKVCGLL